MAAPPSRASGISAARIGAFVIAGLALVIAVVIAAGGGSLFVRKEVVVMHFSGSIFGLQVGAPVVFRGVRLGSVSAIGLSYDVPSDRFSIPVRAELEPGLIRGLPGAGDGDSLPVLPAMVARGLTAQLSMQSLLTGQLYVDLDLVPQRAARDAQSAQTQGGVVEIPTRATAIQNLKNNLDALDFKQIMDDLSVIAASARAVVAGPELKRAMADLVEVTASVRRISGEVEQRLVPLASATERTLDQAQQTLGAVSRSVTRNGDRVGDSAVQIGNTVARMGETAERVGDSAARVGASADRLGAAAERVGDLLAPDAPLVQRVQATADELARTAAGLRRMTAEGGALPVAAERTLADLGRAARALRELADQLQAQPEALIRGTAPPQAWPSPADPGQPQSGSPPKESSQ